MKSVKTALAERRFELVDPHHRDVSFIASVRNSRVSRPSLPSTIPAFASEPALPARFAIGSQHVGVDRVDVTLDRSGLCSQADDRPHVASRCHGFD